MLKSLFDSIGQVALFGARAIRDAWVRPFECEYLLTQFYEIGVGSFFLIIASGLALGVVMTLHTRSTLVQFGATAEIPVFQSLAFFNEIGPLVAALLMAGRVGAGMGAQLANMRATEQIDAIETLSVDSFKLLVVTRVIACTVMLPLLTMFMDAAGILGGFLSEHIWSHLSWTLYIQRAFDGVALADFLPPTLKTAVFGYLIAVISCFYGYNTNEGSDGVRKAATNSVVVSSLVVILADVILVKCIFFFFPGPGHMTEGQASGATIAFEQVEKGFDDRKILDKVSFTVAQGEALCILGRSGTGKSVTLKLMIGLLKADAGTVLVAGEDMSTLEESRLARVRRKMGYLFQSAALFDSFTLNQNLAMPLHRLAPNKSPEEVKRAVEETLGEVGLGKDGNKMPAALSGGMQKRAGLARALVLQPEILLVDEPASGLDRITASEIDDLLMKVKTERHTTMVIVTHDIHGARKIADKFAVLDQGRLLAFGTPQELDGRNDKRLQQFIAER